jgi:peptidoglycan DL-endopeptidase CwlO
VNFRALIWVSFALAAPVLPVADAQVSGSAAASWNKEKGRIVAELAAKSTDDDDDSTGKGAHTSAGKKKAASDDTDEKSFGSKTAAAKKKKKKPAPDDDAGAGSDTGAGKKSTVSDDDSPGAKKKKTEDSGDDSAAQTKPKSPDTASDHSKYAPNATVEPTAIVEFANQPERVQRLITAALDLTKQNLTYSYGSAEPSNGGMDCSGTIYYLLHSQGFQDVPRDSSGQYVWARKEGRFFAVISTRADSFEFKDLMPGDLMFWSGTYQVERDIPITHVMLYLGNEKGTGKRIMFGASDGRSYNGLQRWGVSVFDFKMPKADPNNAEKRRVDFVGYARIPGLREAQDPSPANAAASEGNNPPAKHMIAKDDPAKEADQSTPAPKKKKSTVKDDADETTPAPKKKSTVKDDGDETTPPPKKKSAVKKSTPRKRAEDADN